MSTLSLHDYIIASPELFVLGMTCVVLLADLFFGQRLPRLAYSLAQVTLLGGLALTLVIFNYGENGQLYFHGFIVHDQIASILKITIYASSLFVFLYARDYLTHHNMLKGEFYTLGLLSILGMLVAVSAYNFLVVYLGIELIALPTYAMVALYRDSEKSTEAAIKYFVLGALSSGMLLYGLSLIYGATHSLDIQEVANFLAYMPKGQSLVLTLGLVFIVAGLAFKLGAVPFHMWIPDVYAGAPTVTTLFITVAPKVAGFGIVIRLLVDGLYGLHDQWQQLFILLALLSMFVGNIVAIVQTNIRRMLAYSTIAHGGYMLLGFCAATADGFAASMFYTITYALMSLAGFGLLALLARAGMDLDNIDDLRGLNARNPWLALMMLLILFSMAGIPPTVGFFAKVGVLEALVSAHLVWLACIAIILAVIGSYYYLRVVKVMYFDEPQSDDIRFHIPIDTQIGLSINGLAILALGMLPSSLIHLSRMAFIG